jgi:HdeA/HdeB family
MRRMLVTIALAGFTAMPALAMDDMSCADFTGMDAAKQAETVAMMSEDAMASGSMMASSDATADEPMAADLAAACADHPDMMLDEAMQGAMMHDE